MTTSPSDNDPQACDTPGPVSENAEPPDDDALAAMGKAIGHPARVAILRHLAHRDTCVTGDLVDQLPLAQSTISEHLRILREAGLIQGEIDGPRTRYCIDQYGLASLRSGVASF